MGADWSRVEVEAMDADFLLNRADQKAGVPMLLQSGKPREVHEW